MNIIYCPKCKSEIEGDSRFCDQCGAEVFYCSNCHRPGKGLRCTACGALMVKYDDLTGGAKEMETSLHVTKRESAMAAALGATHRSGMPQLFLVNDSLQMRLAGVDGAILGRRMGIYHEVLASCHYISGTHAQLAYVVPNGWTLADKGSSNGTFINGQKILPNEPMRLRNGDRVVLANVEFRVEIK